MIQHPPRSRSLKRKPLLKETSPNPESSSPSVDLKIENVIDRFQEKRIEFQRIVEEELDRLTRFESGCPQALKDAIRHSLLAPAKRLRPVLLLMTCEACGARPASALPAACAVEMIHTYSLIHDDLPSMDDDDLRRGLPSCHAKFGESTAILAGDALLAYAFEVISKIESPSTALLCSRELARTAGPTQLVGGQIDDLAAENQDGLDQSDLERIHSRKTGAMITNSARLGGIVAGADERTLMNLTNFGSKIGLAFQIVDDLLDFSGDQVKIGKSLGKDSKSQKLTYVRLFGVEKSRHLASDLIQDAIESVRNLGSPAEPLVGLAQFILHRTY